MVCTQQHLGTSDFLTLLRILLSGSHEIARLTLSVHMMAHSEQRARATSSFSMAVREAASQADLPHDTHHCRTCKDAEDGR